MQEDPRQTYRKIFIAAWQKSQQGDALSTLEQAIVALIQRHSEYLPALQGNATANYDLNENPFLHLSLHLSLQEQLQLDRPTGIRVVYEALLHENRDAHQVEHHMMDVLAQELLTAQETHTMPDEQRYLTKLQRLVVG